MNTQSPKRILVIAVPGIGDALLATPLVRSLKRKYPTAHIDMMVREGNEGIVENNSDIQRVIAFPRRPGVADYLRLVKNLTRRYGLAVSTSAGDRSFSNCLLASSKRAVVVPPKTPQEWWKYILSSKTVQRDEETHTIIQNLRLADALNVPRSYEVVLPAPQANASINLGRILGYETKRERFAVVHMVPGSPYKEIKPSTWVQIIESLISQGLKVVCTGGGAAAELAYIDSVMSQFSDQQKENSLRSLAGKLNFSEVVELVSSATVFLGTDTSTTHLAAASGTTTIAIYGPSNVVKWSPWPKDYAGPQPPFSGEAGVERNGNVTVLRAACRCLPFHKSCNLTEGQQSQCLSQLSADFVVAEVQSLLRVA